MHYCDSLSNASQFAAVPWINEIEEIFREDGREIGTFWDGLENKFSNDLDVDLEIWGSDLEIRNHTFTKDLLVGSLIHLTAW